MSSRLADRLTTARRRHFVGRTPELAEFRACLAAPEWPWPVVYVFGPGGVGKTALLGELRHLSAEAGLPAHYLDAHHIEPTPEAFLGALSAALSAPAGEPPLAFLGRQPGRCVLCFDTCEALAPLDAWLWSSFLPELPANVLVILAGRQPPAAAWRADPGWQALVHVWPLRNLPPDESRAYLAGLAVPEDQYPAVLRFTHGHPLALALVADVFHQRAGQQFQPEAAPDIVKALLERFLQKVPGPAHRAALEAASLVRVTTEGLLATMLGHLDVHELFAWLRDLSFIEAGPAGLFPHDLAREALAADVRWRNPDWYAELHRRARADYVARIQRTTGLAQQQALFDLIFLHRDNAVVRPVFEWQTGGHLLADAFAAGDRPALLAQVARHEGALAADLAARWLERQPANALVVRDPDGQPVGYLQMVSLPDAGPDDEAADPALGAVGGYLRRHAPLRPGEAATLFRFWLARETYQAVSPVQSLIFVSAVRHYLVTPNLAYTFFPCAEPDFWAPVFAYADLTRLPEADYTVAGRQFGVYGHDWRARPPAAWLSLLAEREIAPGTPPPASHPPLIVLSAADFAEAVRDALQHFTQPNLLRGNPLLRSRLVAAAAETDRPAALLALLTEAAEPLRAAPRDAKAFRALEATYFRPAPTQELAAEQLDLPFSTFRRHLKTGVDRVVAALWQRELGGGAE